MRSPWSSLILVFATACSFQASCGGKNLNMDNARTFVAKTLEAETGQRPEPTCPSSVKIEKGGTFACTAKFGSVDAQVVIQQDDDQGNVTMKSITGIVISAKLEKEIADAIGKQTNMHIEVACGDRIRAAVAGGTFQCDAKDANGQGAKVNVTVKDVSGNVSWEVPKP